MAIKASERCGQFIYNRRGECVICLGRKNLCRKIEIAIEALSFYAEDSINNHRYHADMGSDLRVKAQSALEKIKEQSE